MNMVNLVNNAGEIFVQIPTNQWVNNSPGAGTGEKTKSTENFAFKETSLGKYSSNYRLLSSTPSTLTVD